jgi:hypothetical protein
METTEIAIPSDAHHHDSLSRATDPIMTLITGAPVTGGKSLALAHMAMTVEAAIHTGRPSLREILRFASRNQLASLTTRLLASRHIDASRGETEEEAARHRD